mmetsp:Transcript_34012/g.38648  ORF Transcript_34012/g.38648 Transcript_34012/m.38648 type:complete len:125 (+) Transcript_34012:191-565(+)
MGTDPYQYSIVAKEGKALKVLLRSGRECDPVEKTKGFWVSGLCDLEAGGYKFDEKYNIVPNCPLTKHASWKDVPFECYPCLTIDNVREGVFEELKDKIKSFGPYAALTGRKASSECDIARVQQV